MFWIFKQFFEIAMLKTNDCYRMLKQWYKIRKILGNGYECYELWTVLIPILRLLKKGNE